MKLSIIICTYNRDDVLPHCLESLVQHKSDNLIHEVVLVDNNPSDSTLKIYNQFASQIPNFKYIPESNTGLSVARNAGVKNATGDWLFFLDDDAKVREETIKEIAKMIRDYDFDFFTGIWKAWHTISPPNWFPYDAGSYKVKGDSGIRDIGDDYISGGVMVINKDVFLREVGAFPSDLGMTGDKIGYGEESYVENELKEKGYSVGINTDIIIDHLVNPAKYELSWHLEAAFQKGYANAFLYGGESTRPSPIGLATLVLTGWIKPMLKWVFKKKYYYENFVIDYIGAIRYLRGSISRHQE